MKDSLMDKVRESLKKQPLHTQILLVSVMAAWVRNQVPEHQLLMAIPLDESIRILDKLYETFKAAYTSESIKNLPF